MTPIGQTADGRWQVGVRRTAHTDPATAWRLLREVLDEDDHVSEIRSQTPGTVVRAAYRKAGWDRDATLQLRLLSAAMGTTLAVHLEGMPDAAARAEMRARWTATLERLVRHAASRAESTGTATPDAR